MGVLLIYYYILISKYTCLMKQILILFALAIVFFSSCKKEQIAPPKNNNTSTHTPPDPDSTGISDPDSTGIPDPDSTGIPDRDLTGIYYGSLHKNIYYLGYRPPHYTIDSTLQDTLLIELVQASPQKYAVTFNKEKEYFEFTPNQYRLYKNQIKSNQDSLVFDYEYSYGGCYDTCALTYYYHTGKIRLKAYHSAQDAYYHYLFLEN